VMAVAVTGAEERAEARAEVMGLGARVGEARAAAVTGAEERAL
jgi:hypothetical protein